MKIILVRSGDYYNEQGCIKESGIAKMVKAANLIKESVDFKIHSDSTVVFSRFNFESMASAKVLKENLGLYKYSLLFRKLKKFQVLIKEKEEDRVKLIIIILNEYVQLEQFFKTIQKEYKFSDNGDLENIIKHFAVKGNVCLMDINSKSSSLITSKIYK